MRQGGTNGIRIQRRRSTATKRSPCWPRHADAQKRHEQQSATPSRATQDFVSAADRQNTAEWPSEHGHKHTARPPLGRAHSTASGRGSATEPQRRTSARHPYQPLLFASPRRTRRQALPLDLVRECPRPAGSSTLPRTVLYPRLSGLCAYGLLYVPRLGRSRAHRRGKAAQGPRRARLFFRLFDPALAMASRNDAPYLSDRPCVVGAALRRRHHPPKCLRAHVPHHGLYL